VLASKRLLELRRANWKSVLAEQRAEGYEPDRPSVYAQSNGEYGETQEVTGP
jgi:hypothetical protein